MVRHSTQVKHRPYCLFVIVPQIKLLRFTQYWVRREHVQPFSHTCTPTVIHVQVRCYLLLWLLHSDFGDFMNGVCHVIKVTIAESNPDMGLLAQQTFCFSSDVLAGDSKMPIKTMSRCQWRQCQDANEGNVKMPRKEMSRRQCQDANEGNVKMPKERNVKKAMSRCQWMQSQDANEGNVKMPMKVMSRCQWRQCQSAHEGNVKMPMKAMSWCQWRQCEDANEGKVKMPIKAVSIAPDWGLLTALPWVSQRALSNLYTPIYHEMIINYKTKTTKKLAVQHCLKANRIVWVAIWESQGALSNSYILIYHDMITKNLIVQHCLRA